MDRQKLEYYLMSNAKYFPQERLGFLRQRLEQMDEDRFFMLSAMELRDPTMMLVVSILVGGLGVDRFLLGDTGIGVLKLLTGGCCGVLTIVDWFLVQGKTREYNFNRIMNLL